MECTEEKIEYSTKWSGLYGQPIDKVFKYLSERYPDLDIYKVPYGTIVTDDLRLNRVRIYYDKDGLVCSDPITR